MPTKDPSKSLASLLHATASQHPHKGMDDSVPAVVSSPNGQSPAALSAGEYVIPADVVSMIGDGDTTAGSQILDHLVSQVRVAKTGKSKQASPITQGMSNLLNPQGK